MRLIIALFLVATLLGAKPVGKVVTVKGMAFLKKSNTTKFRRLKKGTKLSNGDLIKTTSRGKVKIIFNDNSIIFIARKSKIRIDKYEYNAFSKTRGAQLSLLSGRLKSWVSKLASNKRRFKIKTPTAVIGVRGTQFIVSVGENNETEVGVIEGSVAVENVLDVTKTSVLLTSNKFTKVLGVLPVMPGREMSVDLFKKMNDGFDIETDFKVNTDYSKLYKKLDMKKSFKKQEFKKIKRKSLNKKNKLSNKKKRGQKGVNGRFVLPKVKVKFNAKIEGE